jgi:hypothetical protein
MHLLMELQDKLDILNTQQQERNVYNSTICACQMNYAVNSHSCNEYVPVLTILNSLSHHCFMFYFILTIYPIYFILEADTLDWWGLKKQIHPSPGILL